MSEYPESRIQDLLTRRNIDWSTVVRIAEVGSTAHGISTPDTDDDFDCTVVRVESFTELVVGNPNRQSMMIRTQPDGIRSRMGDIDLQAYTLRKFASLAAKGNPSILAAIFSQGIHRDTGVDFDKLGRMVASRRAGSAFLGYMNQQLERWQGLRGQKNVKRPELVDAYGFDTKYAAHVIRLGSQGIEYMQNGRFAMPLLPPLAEDIVALRMGQISEENALAWAFDVERELLSAVNASKLPEQPASESINAWLVDQYGGRPYAT